MKLKTILIIIAVIIAAVILIWFFADRFSGCNKTTQLQRAEPEEQEISAIEQVIAYKDTVINRLRDSLQLSRENVKVIIKTVKEDYKPVFKPITDLRVKNFKSFLNEHYELRSKEVGINSPTESFKPELSLSPSEFRGGELLIIDFKAEKHINTELNTQIDLLTAIDANRITQITQLNKIISLKEIQLVKMERAPVPILNTRSFWVDLGIITGSLAVGFTVGIIYQNFKR